MLSFCIIFLHIFIIWAAPFKSLYSTTPAILLLLIFLTIFFVCAKFMLKLSRCDVKETPTSLFLKDCLFDNYRFRRFLLLTSTVGICLHIWSKYYLIELRPVECISHIRFAWLEVDRSLLPFHIKLASIFGHLLTSFAYLGMLTTSYSIGRAKSIMTVSRSDIALQAFFMLVGLLYAALIGSRNAILAFFLMNLIGLMMGLSSSIAYKKSRRCLRGVLLSLGITFFTTVAFSSLFFSDRIYCDKSNILIKVEGHEKAVGNYMAGYYSEFSLQERSLGDGLAWRKMLFVKMCPTCSPAMTYVNHGIFNLSKVMAGKDRGDLVLLNFIFVWGERIGLNVAVNEKIGARLHGPGGLTLAGAAYHDYGVLGLVCTAAILGLIFGKSIYWMHSTGLRVLVGVWLFCCLSYVLFLSSMFVGFSLLPFPFIAFGIGIGFLLWISGTLIRRRREI